MQTLLPASIAGYLPGSIAGDISFWLFFVAASLSLGLYLGRAQLVNVVLYAYIATAIMNVLPDSVFSLVPVYGRVSVFAAMLILMILMSDYLFDIHIANVSADFFWRILMMSFLTVGMLLSIVLPLLPHGLLVGYVSTATQGLFVGEWIQVTWLALPLIFLLFVNKRL